MQSRSRPDPRWHSMHGPLDERARRSQQVAITGIAARVAAAIRLADPDALTQAQAVLRRVEDRTRPG